MNIEQCEECINYTDGCAVLTIDDELVYCNDVKFIIEIGDVAEELHLGSVAIDVMVKQLQKLQVKQQKAIEEEE